MPAPIFSLATTGANPKATTRQILEAEVNRVVGITFDQANPEDRVAAAASAATATEQAGIATADATQAGVYRDQAQVAALAAGAPLVTSLTDPVPANGTVEILQSGSGAQVWQVVTGAWSLVGWLTTPNFATIGAMTLATALLDGQIIEVNEGFNGESETFTYDATSTLVADGALVVDATGMGAGQLISTRKTFKTDAEFQADPRPDSFFTTDDLCGVGGPSGYTLKKVQVGVDRTTSGGAKWKVLPGVLGYRAEAFGFGAANTGADNLTALQAANDAVAAAGGGKLTVRESATVEGDFYLSAAVNFDAESVDFTFNNGAFNIDGLNAGAHVDYWSAKIQMTRTGTVGPAINLTGDDTVGFNKAAIRGRLYPAVKGSTGVGIRCANTFIVDIFNPSVRNCADKGWKFEPGPQGVTAANLINIFGGETQQCAGGYSAGSVSGIFWHGHGIEGNSAPCFIGANARDIHHIGGYFEHNANTGYDVIIGDAGASPSSISFSECVFYDGSGATKTHAIQLKKCDNFSISDTRGAGYTTALVDYAPLSGSAVNGTWQNITGISATDAALNRNFRNANSQEVEITATTVWDIPSLAPAGTAGAYANTTLAVPGAAIGDFVQVTRGGSLGQVNLWAEVSATDTVRINAANTDSTAADPGNATFRLRVLPKGYYF
ncbi:MAG: hypothetical protein ACU0BN_02805 [Sulfitobacter sp.]